MHVLREASPLHSSFLPFTSTEEPHTLLSTAHVHGIHGKVLKALVNHNRENATAGLGRGEVKRSWKTFRSSLPWKDNLKVVEITNPRWLWALLCRTGSCQKSSFPDGFWRGDEAASACPLQPPFLSPPFQSTSDLSSNFIKPSTRGISFFPMSVLEVSVFWKSSNFDNEILGKAVRAHSMLHRHMAKFSSPTDLINSVYKFLGMPP